jgi:hypothetical protein
VNDAWVPVEVEVAAETLEQVIAERDEARAALDRVRALADAHRDTTASGEWVLLATDIDRTIAGAD